MIWALLAMYLLGGGGASGSMLTSAGVKELSKRTEVVIEDPTRVDAAQKTLAELRREVKSFEKVFGKSGRALSKSYKDHAADNDHAQALFDDLNANWESAQQRALDLRFELRDSMTEEEWVALFADQ